MTKTDVRSFEDLVAFSQERATGSLRRNDPIAWSYWRETGKWAAGLGKSDVLERPEGLPGWCQEYVRLARLAAGRDDFMVAALEYSRAKWFVIISRNLGIIMNSSKTGVNLGWLKILEKRINDREIDTSKSEAANSGADSVCDGCNYA